MLHLTSCTTSDIAEAHAHRVVAEGELVAELVAALTEMVRWFGDYPEYIPNPERVDEYEAAIAAARAALAKAEGATP